MPTFYFDIDDGTGEAPDAEGCELKDEAEARAGALEVLSCIAREDISENNDKAFSAVVRDDHRNVIFEAKLSLVGKWRGS